MERIIESQLIHGWVSSFPKLVLANFVKAHSTLVDVRSTLGRLYIEDATGMPGSCDVQVATKQVDKPNGLFGNP